MSSASSFRNFPFSHIQRRGNAFTHTLARRARFFFPYIVWMEYVSPDIYKFFFLFDYLAIFYK